MEIVIKISDEDYELVQQGHIPFRVLDVIKNGKPLPKGHGRLIDADEYKHNLIWNKNIDNAPTIIEADKGEE